MLPGSSKDTTRALCSQDPSRDSHQSCTCNVLSKGWRHKPVTDGELVHGGWNVKLESHLNSSGVVRPTSTPGLRPQELPFTSHVPLLTSHAFSPHGLSVCSLLVLGPCSPLWVRIILTPRDFLVLPLLAWPGLAQVFLLGTVLLSCLPSRGLLDVFSCDGTLGS